MSFRYKSALLTLVSLAVIYTYYFVRIAGGMPGTASLRLLVGVIVAIAVTQVAGTVVIALTSTDRWGPMDERERGLDRRATAIGYYLLIAGTLAAAALVHLGAGSGRMANAILLAIVVAECARQAVFMLLHHRAV